MKIKIKALADIEFLSAKVDRKHNIIHVQARNLLDSTGQDCTFPTCSGGKYIAHGFITSVYEDLHVDGYRVLIHLKTSVLFALHVANPMLLISLHAYPEILFLIMTLMDGMAIIELQTVF